jgi:D-amino-acid dehydrogenase
MVRRFIAVSRPSKLKELEAQGATLRARVYDDLLPLEKSEVMGFSHSEGIRAAVLQDGRHIQGNEAVICAGAHSAKRAKLLGEPIPLEPERGYRTQVMSPGIAMKHSIIWPARAFMVTPTAGGIRIGGAVEMAGLDAAPDYRRAKTAVKRAKEALPNLQCEDFTEWMGHRPALPDTVPIMSASAKTKGVFYATGHGHLGLTYAATNARLMADLITGVKPPVDMHPYRVNRF